MTEVLDKKYRVRPLGLRKKYFIRSLGVLYPKPLSRLLKNVLRWQDCTDSLLQAADSAFGPASVWHCFREKRSFFSNLLGRFLQSHTGQRLRDLTFEWSLSCKENAAWSPRSGAISGDIGSHFNSPA